MNGWLWLFSFWSIIYTWFLLCCRLLSLLCAFVKMPRKSWHFGKRPCSASIYFMYVSKPCYFLTQSQGLSLWTCVWSESCSVVSDSLWPHGLYSSWNSPGQNTRVGSLSLLQGIFPAQGSNPGLLHCRQILYHLSHKGSPGILELVAYPFSSRSSRPRNWTRVSCIADGFFTNELRGKSFIWGKLWESYEGLSLIILQRAPG